MKIPLVLKLAILGMVLLVINLMLGIWLHFDLEKISLSILFLLGLYVLSHFIYTIARKKYPGYDAFIYMALLLLKFIFVFIFLFFFLNPKTVENKFEVVLFLMNYFVFLGYDVSWKVKNFNDK